MSIYAKNSYKEVIKERLEARKSLDKSHNYQNMAAFMRVQKPYLSKVMNGRADLNSDQLFKACEYLELNEKEIEYTSLLLEWEKTQFKERKDFLKEKISKIQFIENDASKAAKRPNTLTAKEFDASELVEFYLDPMISIVHVFLSIPKYRREPKKIAEKLQIDEHRLSDILGKLLKMGIIETKNDKIVIKIQSMNLPKDSKMIIPYQKLMAQVCASKKADMPFSKKKAYNVTFSANEDARREIDQEFNKFIGKVRRIVEKHNSTSVYQLSFDLFPWS